MNLRKPLIILLLVFIGWALCGAIVGVGMSLTSEQNTLIAHAIGAPIIFAAISFVYFKKFNYTAPLQTAAIFLSLVILLDFFLAALLIQRSLEMFASLLGTWVPFALIFLSTYLVGLCLRRKAPAA